MRRRIRLSSLYGPVRPAPMINGASTVPLQSGMNFSATPLLQ